MNRRRFAIRVAAAAAAPVLPLAALAQEAPVEGRDYARLAQPLPMPATGKVEVVEFFGYWCPHCNSFEAPLDAWVRKLPAYVAFRRVPVAFSAPQEPYAKIYFTLEALKKAEELHAKVFRAVQVDRRPLLKTDEIADFMGANGIDRKQWLDTFNSFAVGTRASRASQVWKAFKVDGTPAMAIDGKFMTAPHMVGSREGSLPVMDYLIQRARAERGGKK